VLMEEPEAPLAIESLARDSVRLAKKLKHQVITPTHSLEMADAFSKACREEGVDGRAYSYIARWTGA